MALWFSCCTGLCFSGFRGSLLLLVIWFLWFSGSPGSCGSRSSLVLVVALVLLVLMVLWFSHSFCSCGSPCSLVLEVLTILGFFCFSGSDSFSGSGGLPYSSPGSLVL